MSRLGADQVRVDVFVSKDQEEMPIVNEISLSSGHYYRYHTKFIAQEWAEGHRIRDSKPYSGPIPVPENMLKGSRHYGAALAQAIKGKK